jgi:hypothetical protein
MTNREQAQHAFEAMHPIERLTVFRKFNLPEKWARHQWDKIPRDVQKGFTKQLHDYARK